MDVENLLLGILIGAALVAAPMSFWAARHAQRRFDAGRASRDGETAGLDARLRSSEAALQETRATAQAAAEARSALAARMEESASAHAEKLRWIDTAREQLAQQFQSLAASILDAKAERFAARNDCALASK